MIFEYSPIPLVYIAGPYSSLAPSQVVRNVYAVWRLGYRVAELGAMPVIPHKSTEMMHDLHDQAWWLKATMALLKRCDAILFTEDYERSVGARSEEAEAKRLGIPRFYTVGALDQWLHPPESLSFWEEPTELWPGPGV